MHGATVPDGRSVDVQGHYDFDGEAEMKTLQEVHDMMALTGYKEEAETVANAMFALVQYSVAIDKAESAFDEAIQKVQASCTPCK